MVSREPWTSCVADAGQNRKDDSEVTGDVAQGTCLVRKADLGLPGTLYSVPDSPHLPWLGFRTAEEKGKVKAR